MERFNGKRAAQVASLVLRAIDELVLEARPSRPGQGFQRVVELSRLFTRERAALSRGYLDNSDHAAAYLAYFVPVNLAKIQILLDELPPDTVIGAAGDRISVLDLGSGPGTAGLAVLDWLRQRAPARADDLFTHAVDVSRAALQQSEGLWSAYCRGAGITGASLKTYEGDLERLLSGCLGDQVRRGGPYDLIILANCLNELFTEAADPAEARTHLVGALLLLLKPQGTVMLVEPALRQTARDLHLVRDRLLQGGHCTVYSPCLHELNCPALIRPDDWCHEERSWEAPDAIQQIDHEVGFIKDALKFSYLLLRTDGRTIVQRHSETFRVVSELRMLKGDTRAWLCNELGRSEVGQLDRAQSDSNAQWRQCDRGTIMRIDGLRRKEGSTLGRIPAEATVEILRAN